MYSKAFVLLMVFWTSLVQAQNSDPEVVSSAGDNFIGSTMQVDWTLGELAIATLQNASGTITQGFHQPRYLITNLKGNVREIGQIKVFPNPATERINIKMKFDQSEVVKAKLVDVRGQLIWKAELEGSQIDKNFDMRNLPNGSYFIHFIVDDDTYHQAFKIQKID